MRKSRPYKERDLEAERAYKRAWYHANKEKHKATQRTIEQRKREWFREFKKTLKCNRCPENHPACLQFHHRNGEEKKGNIASLVVHWSKERLLAEISKCEVLCANCHLKEHAALSTRG